MYGQRAARVWSRTPGTWILTGIYVIAGVVNVLIFGALVAAAGATTAGPFQGLAESVLESPVLAGLPDATVVGAVTTFGVIMLVLGVLDFAVAWGLWHMRRWAWGLGVVLAIIGLLWFPVGTVAAIVTLVYLGLVRPEFSPSGAEEEAARRPRAV